MYSSMYDLANSTMLTYPSSTMLTYQLTYYIYLCATVLYTLPGIYPHILPTIYYLGASTIISAIVNSTTIRVSLCIIRYIILCSTYTIQVYCILSYC